MGACRGLFKWYAYLSPNRIDGWINQAECLCELHGAEKAVEALLLDEERFVSLLDISLRLDATTP